MNATIAIAIAVVFGLALAAAVRALRREPEGPMPFEQCRPLTEREQVLYWRLRKVMPDEIVLALSLEFADPLNTPGIEQRVAALEKKLRSVHPELITVFIKPQARDQFRQFSYHGP